MTPPFLRLTLALTCAFTMAFFGGCYDKDALQISDRQLRFFKSDGVGFNCSPPTLVNDHIYIGTSRGYRYASAPANFFYKLDAQLNLVWKYPLNERQVRGAATLDSQGNIYFVIDSARTAIQGPGTAILMSLDNAGNFRWSRTLPSNDIVLGMVNPAMSENDEIYVGTDRFLAFDKDGTQLWVYPNDQSSLPQCYSAPIIDPLGQHLFRIGRPGDQS